MGKKKEKTTWKKKLKTKIKIMVDNKLKIKKLDGRKVGVTVTVNPELPLSQIARISVTGEIEVSPYWEWINPKLQLLTLTILIVGSELPHQMEQTLKLKTADVEVVKRLAILEYKMEEIIEMYNALFHLTGKITDPNTQERLSEIKNYPKQTI